MKLSKTFKRFWNMQKHTGGFTLVELIVVIAILAILAGVAIPAYSGYITKANEAADTQLLAAVNRAFASACMEKAINPYALTKNDAQIDIVDGKIKVDSIKPSVLKESFAVYFAGNENAVFKVYGILEYKDGAFVATPSKNVNGYHVREEAINNFKNSIFGSSEEMVTNLQGQVNSLAGAYGQIAGNMRPEDLEAMLGSEYAAYLKDSGANTAAGTGNATVLYIAEKSANMDATDAYNQLAAAGSALAGNKNPSMSDFLTAAGQTGDPLSTAAMMYGAVTAYVNSGNCSESLKTQADKEITGGTDLANLFAAAYADPGFMSYVGESGPSDSFQKDMNGYLGAMSGMNSVSGSLSGDINDAELWEGDTVDQLLKDMMG